MMQVQNIYISLSVAKMLLKMSLLSSLSLSEVGGWREKGY